MLPTHTHTHAHTHLCTVNNPTAPHPTEQVALVPDILKCTDEQPDPNVKKLILMTRKGNKQIVSHTVVID